MRAGMLSGLLCTVGCDPAVHTEHQRRTPEVSLSRASPKEDPKNRVGQGEVCVHTDTLK